MTKAFGEEDRNSWELNDIAQRDMAVSNELSALIDKWVKEYATETTSASKPQPTPEQQEMIRQLKEAGLI
jgi:hypothetical protein